MELIHTNFLKQVREKKQKLADSEADLVKRHRESKEKLEQQKRDLETRVAAFQQEKVTFKDHYLFVNSQGCLLKQVFILDLIKVFVLDLNKV